MSKRLIALVLCICMLLPLFTGAAPVVHAEESRNGVSGYNANIGRKAKFNSNYINGGGFQVSDAPGLEVSWSQASNVPGSSVGADTIVEIVDAYLNATQGTIWYKIKHVDGPALPELMIAEPWVFQNVEGDSADYDSLIFLEEEPEVTEPEPSEPEVTEPDVTEPDVTEPDVTEPDVTEPDVTEPDVTEPDVTEPDVTEPEETEPEETEPEETEPVTCPVCGQVGCNALHFHCEICGTYDCELDHLYCRVCEKYDCSIAHVYCGTCGEYDCGLEHEDEFKPITAPVIPENPILSGAAVSLVDSEGNPIEGELVLEPRKRTSISAWSTLGDGVSYQWQVCYDSANDLWIDIRGEVNKGLVVSPAMFHGIIEARRSALLRCVAYTEDDEQFSAPISVTVASEAGVFSMDRTSEPAAFAAEDDGANLETAYIIVEYVYESGHIAAASDVAAFIPGMAVQYLEGYKVPEILGYEAHLEQHAYPNYIRMEERDSEKRLIVDFPAGVLTGTVKLQVTYKPTVVDYKVIHYQQNVTGYDYTKVLEEELTTYTGTLITDVHKNYTGFYNLIYETPTAAADGSTVIEVYYDRNYYLMKFELDGGFGVDPVYDRYGASLEVDEPTKPGYTFEGWYLNGVTKQDPPQTIPAENRTYYAKWSAPGQVSYTVIYWKENADDNGYSYWALSTKYATAGTVVSGSNDLATSTKDYEFFTYNDAMTDKNVVIKNDGTTVINVYYTRNYYTLVFYYNGKCNIPEHTHGDNCVRDILCGMGEHVHTAECEGTFTCTKEVHIHGANCKCVLDEHTQHTTSCWDGVGTSVSWPSGAPYNPENGQVYVRSSWNYTYYYIYINGSWYNYSGTTSAGQTAPTTCHKHANGDCAYDHESHEHGETCYTYKCGEVAHTHAPECYRECTQYEHTHGKCTYTDGTNTTKKYEIFRVITAKYEADIKDLWPTADDISGLAYWSGVANQSSRLVTLTSDYCFEDGKDLVANYQSTKNTLNYWFEHYDQTVEPDGVTYKKEGGIIYKLSEKYSQVAYYDGAQTWSYKKITGMQGIADSAKKETGNVFNLYYKRARVNLIFYNVNATYKTVTDIMYEQPLAGYKDSSGNLISSYVPPEPQGAFESGSRDFAGWYTSGEYLPGTEVDFETLIMPDNDMTIYAKWTPKKFDLDLFYDSALKELFDEHNGVEYGQILGPLPEPTKDGYRFVGWFYTDANGVEHAFDPANMPVKGGWTIYAKWTSNALCSYTVKFLVEERNAAGEWVPKLDEQGNYVQVAPPITGSGIAGNSYTFDAKSGHELDAEYQEKYFPTVVSHTLNVEIPSDDENAEDPNVYIFWYRQQESVSYTVRYLKEDGTELMPEVQKSSSNVVVTENFVYYEDYVPDAFQKTKLLSATGENVITFWYKYDTQNALYVVNHYVEYMVEQGTNNWVHGGWTLLSTEQGMEKIGTTIYGEPMSIDGYELNETETNKVNQLKDGKISGKLVAEGLQLNFYYSPKMYSYQFGFYLRDDGSKLEEPVTGTAPYGATVSCPAKEIVRDLDGDGVNEDYRLYNPSETVKYITIDGNYDQEVFYYVRATQVMTITPRVVNDSDFPDQSPPETFRYHLRIHAPSFHMTSYEATLEPAMADGTSVLQLVPVLVDGVPVLQFDLAVDQTLTIQKLPTAEYTLTELNVPLGYEVSYSDPGRLENGRYRLTVDAQVDIVVTNEYQPAVLRISKEVEGSEQSTKVTDFEFTVTFPSDVIPNANYTYTVSDETSTTPATKTAAVSGGQMIISLKNGETAQFVNLPLGDYTVAEKDYSESYSTSYRVGTSGDYEEAAQITATLVQDEITEVYCLNSPLGADFTISRSKAADNDQVFVYTVRKMEDGQCVLTITVTVTGNGSTTIRDLPPGTYTVTQENGWSWRYSDGTQTITHESGDTGTTVSFGGNWIDKWLNGNSAVRKNVGG